MAEKNINFYRGKLLKKVDEDELKAEIAQCLQFENLNFLIGAGCSSYKDENEQEIAIPTMKDLAIDFYQKNPGFTIDKKNKAEDRFPYDLEGLLNYFISLVNIVGDNGKKQYLKKITTINKFIFDKVCKQEIPNELLEIYKSFYLRIIKTTRQVPINIYTTNYDLYNETALDELGFMYNNGFLGSAKRIFNANSYNYVVVENLGLSKDVWKSVSNYFNLYKIHGSINWIKEEQPGKTEIPKIIEKDRELIIKRKQYDSLMIYPTPQKDRTTLMVPYSDLFRLMQNNLLKRNSVLITLGYSFSDEHINRIILNALSVYDFRLVIFGDSDMIRKIQDIGDSRIWVINSENKIHYFKNFVNMALPPQDDAQREEMEMKKTIKQLASVLTQSPSDEPKEED